MLIGDKTGPAIIAHTYGDVRDDYLLKQAQRIRLTVQAGHGDEGQGSSIGSSNVSPDVSSCFSGNPQDATIEQTPISQGV